MTDTILNHIDDRAAGIIRITCQAYTLPIDVVMAHNKNRYISRCRRSIMLALRDAGYTYMATAIIMGRDVATVAQAVKKAKQERTGTK